MVLWCGNSEEPKYFKTQVVHKSKALYLESRAQGAKNTSLNYVKDIICAQKNNCSKHINIADNENFPRHKIFIFKKSINKLSLIDEV